MNTGAGSGGDDGLEMGGDVATDGIPRTRIECGDGGFERDPSKLGRRRRRVGASPKVGSVIVEVPDGTGDEEVVSGNYSDVGANVFDVGEITEKGLWISVKGGGARWSA